ncbi:Cytochrome b561 (plasmid) [Caballeronia sp. SBC1]|uniref:cytochrome b n=1 Tax=unclassified Caballeronia TaxID=2646786 RepID=UPI0013E177E4|nr:MULTISPECIES: cytochrome b [unclassified Caballeronia]QIE26895.1 Cytochrome b561 [Caballeronia sp. SBC2]QIN63789.1 Cytochrome b561 [Caballeronia sp. SBC1]
MQTSETLAFSAPARLFHWLTVLLLVVQYVIGWLMPNVHHDTQPVGLIGLHLSFGATIVLLVLMRLAWRVSHKPPAESSVLPPSMRLAAKLTHGLLYVLLIALPLMGWANASARGWAVSLFHVVPLPALAATGSALGHALGDVHKLTAWVLLVLIGLHVLAVLFHQFVIRDGTLGRMLPGVRKMR